MSKETPGGNSQTPAPQSAGDQAASGAKEAWSGTKGDVKDTKESVGKATDALKGLLTGDANVVDAAMAVKGAVDSVKGLSGKISASAMMPVMKALGAFKGQAILPAGKQMDPVLGIDVHMVTIPPSPLPVPMPHPYIGILFNAKDWVSCLLNTFKKDALDALPKAKEDGKGIGNSLAKNKEAIAGIAMGLMGMSASVKFGDIVPRAVTGTPVKSIPHIPMGAGFHAAFVAAVAKNHGKAFLGSLFVSADGDPMTGAFHLNYDCWDIGIVDLFKSQRAGAIKEPPPAEVLAQLYVPSGTIMPIPWGRPVLVNSIPTPINPMAILDKLFKAGLGKLKAAGRAAAQKGLNALNGKVGCGPLTAASKLIGTAQSHPVDVSSGHFYTDNVDFSLPGPIPLSFERTWYSYSDYKGPLGYGWHHSYDMALAIDESMKKAILRMADGRVTTFDLPVLDKEIFNRSEKLTLHLHEEGYYYVTDVKGLIYRFTINNHKNAHNNTETHLLQSIANRNGFAIRFTYDNNSLLKQITDSAGRILTVNNDSLGRIINIQAPDPRFGGRTTFAITNYTYSSEGDMEKHADALNQPMFFYYENHLMVKEIWRNGCNWHFKYNKPSGTDAKCIEVWGTGDLLHYKFDYTDPQYTAVTNSRGFKKLFYHKNGVVIKHVDALEAEWEYHFNQYNELEWETNPLGNQKTTTYDEWGNVTTVTEANGAFLQVSYGSGFLKHTPIESTDKAGGKWKWDYDDFGNLIKRTNPIKAETKYEYVDGFLKSITNAKGSKTYLEYDTSYNLIKVVSSNRYETYWSYDILGNCIKSLDSVGNNRRIQFNLLLLPEIINERDGNIRYLKYDTEGNVIHAKDKQYEISFRYDLLNNLLFRVQAGNGVAYKYDTEGNLVELRNEHNEKYSFEIDGADRIIKETSFDGITRKYTRNEAGKVSHVERATSKFTKYSYNEVGNITEVIYQDSSFEKYDYDSNGLLSMAENPYSKILFERDILGRIIKETNFENSINYKYDIDDNRVLISSTLGALIENDFDEFGNVIKTQAGSWQSSKIFNDLGLEIDRTLPGGINCLCNRDKLGRPTNQNIRNKTTILHSRQYTWNLSYRLQRINDSETGVTQFCHDNIGSLVKTIFDDGEEQLQNSDLIGNLVDAPNHFDLNHGKNGRVSKSNGNFYKFDEEGYLIEKKEASGKIWQYQWNSTGMLQCVLRPDGDKISFTYDALGRRLSKKYKNTITKWLWDGNKPLHEWKEHNKTGIKLGYSTVETDGIITWIFNENNFAPVAKLKDKKNYSILTDYLGTPYQMYNGDGEKFWEAQLDSYGKVRMYKGEEGSCPFRYQGQYEDIETGLYYNRFRYYLPDNGHYISQDPLRLKSGILNFYSYVKDVNIFFDPLGLAPLQCHINGQLGNQLAEQDIINANLIITGREVTMIVNGSRIRADFVAVDAAGNTHVIEAKYGNSSLTPNQAASGVFNMNSPSNTSGGGLNTAGGTTGNYTVATDNRPGVGSRGSSPPNGATFHTATYP